MQGIGDSMDSIMLSNRIRIHALDMVHAAHASHIGGMLSCADIIAVLYADVAHYDCNNPKWDRRDRVILSKGHSGAVIYAALAECNFFPIEKLKEYGQNGSQLSCHLSHRGVPGVEISTGSLGNGVCVACGMALSLKVQRKAARVFAIIGDGECNEGSVWEMAMLAAQKRLDNFTVIVDRNHMQALGFCKDIIDMEPLSDKWKSFGWSVTVVENGHDHDQLRSAFHFESDGTPKVIIANTVKGHGVSFMENNIRWHYSDPKGDEYNEALKELREYKG